jgi:hypothetical protein
MHDFVYMGVEVFAMLMFYSERWVGVYESFCCPSCATNTCVHAYSFVPLQGKGSLMAVDI